MDLAEKVVVVTGGSTGIGRASAQLLAQRGARLVLAARRAERLEPVVRQLADAGTEVIGVSTDVADFEQVERLADATFERFGRVDVGFFNAGVAGIDRLVDPDLAAWHAAFDINVFGLLHCLKAFLPRMLAQGSRCSVLATTSGAGIHGTTYVTAPYAAAKNAQLTIMESLYGQARDEGIPLHVGVVVPPLTRTNLAGDDLSVWEMVQSGLNDGGVPAALIEPEEFAHVIIDGIEQERFWIEATPDDDDRYFGGRNAATIIRTREIIQAKADALAQHRPPDDYLW